jgi:acyl-coenzyme A thioesterase PaaI-like protein
LNSDTLITQAAAFADRAVAEEPADPVGHALRLAFARPATEEERARLAGFVEEQTRRHAVATPGKPEETRRRALADLCHMLLSANEFAYID